MGAVAPRQRMKQALRRAFVFALFVVPLSALGSGFEARVDEREGLPVVTRGGAPVVTSNYAFWRKGWSWSGQQTKFTVHNPFDYSTETNNAGLDFQLATRVKRPKDR